MALICLIAYEPRRDEPLLDLRFFRSAPFSGATVIAICAFAALGGFLFLNTLYLQDVRGYSALHAGLYLLPMAAMTLLLAPLSGRIVAARGPRLPLIVAGIATTAGGIMLTRLTRDSSVGYLVACYVVFGIGCGMVNAPITNTAVSGMPRSQAGVAAGIASTSRQVGSTLGVAVLGSAVLSSLHGLAAAGLRRRQPRGLVDHRRVRRGDPARRPRHQRPLGPRHRGAHRRPPHAAEPAGAGLDPVELRPRSGPGRAHPPAPVADTTANTAPWSSASTAIRPYGVSQAGRTTLPPSSSALATAASASATPK